MATKTGSGINDVIGDKRADILRLAKRHGVYNVQVFGSVARGDAGPDSDVDFVVDGLENAAWGGGRLLMDLQTCLVAASIWSVLTTYTGQSAKRF